MPPEAAGEAGAGAAAAAAGEMDLPEVVEIYEPEAASAIPAVSKKFMVELSAVVERVIAARELPEAGPIGNALAFLLARRCVLDPSNRTVLNAATADPDNNVNTAVDSAPPSDGDQQSQPTGGPTAETGGGVARLEAVEKLAELCVDALESTRSRDPEALATLRIQACYLDTCKSFCECSSPLPPPPPPLFLSLIPLHSAHRAGIVMFRSRCDVWNRMH